MQHDGLTRSCDRYKICLSCELSIRHGSKPDFQEASEVILCVKKSENVGYMARIFYFDTREFFGKNKQQKLNLIQILP